MTPDTFDRHTSFRPEVPPLELAELCNHSDRIDAEIPGLLFHAQRLTGSQQARSRSIPLCPMVTRTSAPRSKAGSAGVPAGHQTRPRPHQQHTQSASSIQRLRSARSETGSMTRRWQTLMGPVAWRTLQFFTARNMMIWFDIRCIGGNEKRVDFAVNLVTFVAS